MSTHTLTTIIPMNADDFYALTETKDFDQFQVPYLGLNSLELKEEVADDLHIFRRVCIKPKTSVPKILLKFANNQSEVSYEDTQIKSRVKREITFKTNPPLLPDNIHVEGVITIEPLDNNTCLKVLKVTFRFTGPLQWFSSVIENNILSELKKTMETLPKIVVDYKKHLESNGLSIPPSPLRSDFSQQQIQSIVTPSPTNYTRISAPKSPTILGKEPVAQFV